MTPKDLENKGLGRLHAPDERDHNFKLVDRLPDVPLPDSKYWWNLGARLDQGNTGTCVAHGWTHRMENAPVVPKGTINPFDLYREIVLADEFSDNDFEANEVDSNLQFGSSVRGGAKVLAAKGLITEYTWAFDLDTAIRAILTKGPVVIGVNWYTGMFYPKIRYEKPVIEVTGGVEGGHCVCIDGASNKLKLVRILNSWGPDWGYRGMAYLSFSDFERLILEDGEVCMPTERSAA